MLRMIRICPKRDIVCPHGMDCPYVLHRYDCKPEPGDKDHPEKSPDKPISGDV